MSFDKAGWEVERKYLELGGAALQISLSAREWAGDQTASRTSSHSRGRQTWSTLAL